MNNSRSITCRASTTGARAVWMLKASMMVASDTGAGAMTYTKRLGPDMAFV